MKCVVLVGVVATLSGCSFPAPPRAGQEEPDAPTSGEDGRQGDAGRLDGPPCTPGYINLCDVTARPELLTLSASTTINTSTDARCIVKAQVNGPELCILYFARVDIPTGVTVTAIGTRALVLASTTTLNIAGTLDVGSRRTRADRAAAANHSTCTFNAAPENDAGGGGGGAGGSFATQGGAGGTGDQNDDNQQGGSASGGTPGAAVALPPVLRGGCPGQRGGNGLGAGGGVGGASGGAVYLFAKAALTISGRVQATGAGGTGASARNGGGGAGSGGTIVIESETQSALSGIFLANGGGGGEGGGAPVTGMDEGKSGEDANALTAAPGGNDITGGGNGGSGATYFNGALVQAGSGMAADGGGGGGGGGNGFISVRGAGRMLTGAFAPQPL